MSSPIRSVFILLMPLFACAPSLLSAVEPVFEKRVALVFDDGPVPENAEPLLALLAKEKIHVTFSLIGARVKENAATARAMATAGHEIANHSMTHAQPKDIDDPALEKEVVEAQKTISSAIQSAPKWYWPPYLYIDDRVRATVARAQLAIYIPKHLVGSKDYDTSVSAAEILRLSTTDVRDGSVILFHEWRKETREQLPAIIAELHRQNCVFLTFSELAKALSDSKNGATEK